jgi:hypothetical protein
MLNGASAAEKTKLLTSCFQFDAKRHFRVYSHCKMARPLFYGLNDPISQQETSLTGDVVL